MIVRMHPRQWGMRDSQGENGPVAGVPPMQGILRRGSHRHQWQVAGAIRPDGERRRYHARRRQAEAGTVARSASARMTDGVQEVRDQTSLLLQPDRLPPSAVHRWAQPEASMILLTVVLATLLTPPASPTPPAADRDSFVVSGTITDGSTQRPIVGATVMIQGHNAGTHSGSAGRYRLAFPLGSTTLTVNLIVRMIGYSPVTRHVAVTG